MNRRAIFVGLALLATAGLSACSATRPPGSAGPGSTQTTTVAPAATVGATPPAPAPSATPTGPAGVQNLVITSAEKSELTAAFVAVKGISLSDVSGGGPLPGTVYYAYDPATGTYWALADFAPSTTASFQTQVNFQDGGGMGMFREAAASAWQAQLGGVPAWCAESQFFPLPVLAAWSMPTTKPAGLGC